MSRSSLFWAGLTLRYQVDRVKLAPRRNLQAAEGCCMHMSRHDSKTCSLIEIRTSPRNFCATKRKPMMFVEGGDTALWPRGFLVRRQAHNHDLCRDVLARDLGEPKDISISGKTTPCLASPSYIQGHSTVTISIGPARAAGRTDLVLVRESTENNPSSQ